MKICFIAPSGYGKSTAIALLSKKYKIKNIKIATPLYELQKDFYHKLDIDIGDKQDGELLQFYGTKVRKEKPLYLLHQFEQKVNECENLDLIITNDDCRPYDYEYLKMLGFIFIRINGYKRERNDHTPINTKLSIEWQNDIYCDYEIDNFGDIETYEENVFKEMEAIINDKKVLCYTNSKKV